jgi:hypothetical protein
VWYYFHYASLTGFHQQERFYGRCSGIIVIGEFGSSGLKFSSELR